MATKTKQRHLNGSPALSTKEIMAHPERILPSETLRQHNILPTDSNTKVQPTSDFPSIRKAAQRTSGPQDTGHNVNYDNFGQLIQFVIQIGTPPYSPPGTRLPLEQLQALYTACAAAVDDLQEKDELETVARNERRAVFNPVPELGARVNGQLMACGVDEVTLTNFRTFMNELTGRRKKKIDTTDPSARHISASHTTFPNRIAAWGGIVTLCTGCAGYESEDPSLAPAGLAAVKTQMVTTNTAVQAAKAVSDMSRMHRDEVFYASTTSLVPVALDVKAYIKAMFGYNSPQFRMVNHLKFRNLMGK